MTNLQFRPEERRVSANLAALMPVLLLVIWALVRLVV